MDSRGAQHRMPQVRGNFSQNFMQRQNCQPPPPPPVYHFPVHPDQNIVANGWHRPRHLAPPPAAPQYAPQFSQAPPWPSIPSRQRHPHTSHNHPHQSQLGTPADHPHMSHMVPSTSRDYGSGMALPLPVRHQGHPNGTEGVTGGYHHGGGHLSARGLNPNANAWEPSTSSSGTTRQCFSPAGNKHGPSANERHSQNWHGVLLNPPNTTNAENNAKSSTSYAVPNTNTTTSQQCCSSSPAPADAQNDPWTMQNEDNTDSGANGELGAINGDNDPWAVAMRKLDEENRVRNRIGLIINNRYRIVSKISFGSYGSIFAGVDITTKQPHEQVAIKWEQPIKSQNSNHLTYEYKVYKVIGNEHNPQSGGERIFGIPRALWFGNEYDHNILVIDLLGPSLEQLFSFCDNAFSLGTVCMLGVQMTERLRHVHQCGFLHRDVKPDNFLVGRSLEDMQTLYLIDYGLARRYRFREGTQLRHIPLRRTQALVGTARYASINSHNRMELSRRDDLESMCYVLIYYARGGKLPWTERQHAKRNQYRSKKTEYHKIKLKKEQTPILDLVESCPPEFGDILTYVRGMGFDEQPNYDHILNLLRRVLVRNDISERSLSLDWAARVTSSPAARFSYECSFKWTLAPGTEPKPPPAENGPHNNGFEAAHGMMMLQI